MNKLITTILLVSSLNTYCKDKEFCNVYQKNKTKVSFYDKVNNIYYTHDYIMKYNDTTMKPIKIMIGIFLPDTIIDFENPKHREKIYNKTEKNRKWLVGLY